MQNTQIWSEEGVHAITHLIASISKDELQKMAQTHLHAARHALSQMGMTSSMSYYICNASVATL
jgi:S-ribosylhomocysteine lyase LuxS involved in autoinducer biosynthesis